jgi:Tfp pilus assembly protein PilV
MIKTSPGITLIELVIAITLVSLVVVGLSNINIFSHSQALEASRRTTVQNEVTLALDHMTKEISRAIGDANNFPVLITSPGLRVRVDSNLNGRYDAGDDQIAYSFSGNQIGYFSRCCSGSPALVARRIVEFTPTLTSNYYLNVRIRACWTTPTPVETNGTADNPCVVMSTNIRMPSVAAH